MVTNNIGYILLNGVSIMGEAYVFLLTIQPFKFWSMKIMLELLFWPKHVTAIQILREILPHYHTNTFWL